MIRPTPRAIVALAAVVTASMTLVPATLAQDDEPEKNWKNKTELGFVNTSGNSETTNFAFANKYTRTWERAEFVFDASALRAEQTTRVLGNPDGTVSVTENTETTAEAYALAGKYTRQWTDRLGWYGSLRWYQNEFAGIDTRYTAGAGLSYTFFDTDVHKLVGELGGDYTDEESVDGTSDSFAGARGFTGYTRTFGKKSEFSSEVEVLQNLDDTDDLRANWTNSVTASLTERMALKVSYTMMYDNQPIVVLVAPDPGAPPGTPNAPFEFDDLDTILSASLVINF